MNNILLASLPVVTAFIGGWIVFRSRRDLHPWLSLSGGLLLGVALMDLLPEAIELAQMQQVDLRIIGWTLVVTLLVFHMLDRWLGVHAHHDDAHEHVDEPCHNPQHVTVRLWVRAVGMCLHRLVDGLAIGGGLAIDVRLGSFIALAVAVHSFADGMSFVAVLRDAIKTHSRTVIGLLSIAAAAPILGSVIGTALNVPVIVLVVLLTMFSGFFLFLALSELLPQAHAAPQSRRLGFVLTIVGVAVVAMLTEFVH